MKIVKGIAIAFGVVVLLAALGLLGVFGYIRTAPSPDDVCAHIARFSTNPTLAGSPLALRLCAEQLRRPQFDQVRYASRMRCYMNAESNAAVDACDRGRRRR